MQDAWAYLNRAENIRRRIIVAAIIKGDKKRYLIELEQRSAGECSTLLLWNPVKEVSPKELLAVVEECIDNNATYLTSSVFGHTWSKLRHSWKKNEHTKPEHFLGRVFEAGASLHGI
jgi:glutathionylspermidine synthase